MKVFIGSDHGGFYLKGEIILLLKELDIPFEDVGTNSDQSVDFGPIAKQVGDRVVAENDSRGILLCGTGIGMSIMANKIIGIRAAVVHDTFSAKATRAHNDSNVLCMGVIKKELAKEITKIWIETPFDGGRYQRRLDFIRAFEGKSRREG